MRYYDASTQTVLEHVHSTEAGLSQAEAQKRLEQTGKNRLAQPKKDGILKRFFQQLLDPMILILLPPPPSAARWPSTRTRASPM